MDPPDMPSELWSYLFSFCGNYRRVLRHVSRFFYHASKHPIANVVPLESGALCIREFARNSHVGILRWVGKQFRSAACEQMSCSCNAAEPGFDHRTGQRLPDTRSWYYAWREVQDVAEEMARLGDWDAVLELVFQAKCHPIKIGFFWPSLTRISIQQGNIRAIADILKAVPTFYPRIEMALECGSFPAYEHLDSLVTSDETPSQRLANRLLLRSRSIPPNAAHDIAMSAASKGWDMGPIILALASAYPETVSAQMWHNPNYERDYNDPQRMHLNTALHVLVIPRL